MKKLVAIVLVVLAVLLASQTAFAVPGNQDQCNSNNPQNCPDPTSVCDNGQSTGNPHCVIPTPTHGVTPTPTSGVTPAPTVICNADHDCVPTATPTPGTTVTPTTPPSDHGDGLSDGRSDGGRSGSSNSVQAVLGASTMADTGTFDTNIMNFVLLGGMLSMGAVAYAKAKKA